MRKIKPRWDGSSIIQANTDIDLVVPSDPVWNYVSFSNHPEIKEKNYNNYGKWLLFVPDEIFVETFRELAKLAASMQLTGSFKASGGNDDGKAHVFCIYCPDYWNIPFVRKIADTLLKHGFIERFGYKYRDGTKAIYFKTDETTYYKSRALGEHLTLFRYTDKGELFVKEFDENENPSWKLVTTDDSDVVKNFNAHLMGLVYSEEGEDLDR